MTQGVMTHRIIDFMKFNFNSDDNLPIQKELKMNDVGVVIRPAFYDNNKY